MGIIKLQRNYVPEDENGNLALLDHRIGASSLRSYEYEYDKNGMRENMIDNDGTHDYVYDILYQITEATHPTVSNPTEQFSYDEVGNRVGPSVVHNELNQLVEDEGFTYEYDLDGNMTLKIDKTTGDSTKYTWDIENKLKKVEKPGTIVEYFYGPLGRRLAKIVNGVRKEFRYDGEDLIIEMNVNDSIIANYTYGPGIDQPVIMNRNGNNYYYIADGLGSITALTDETGNVVQEYKYSVFGLIVEQTGDSIVNPFTYTAREWDEEVGIYYYRARFYNPHIGRFVSEDPLSIHTNDLQVLLEQDGIEDYFLGTVYFLLPVDYNLYRYVENSPSNYVDPEGKFAATAMLVGALTGAAFDIGFQTIFNLFDPCKNWYDYNWDK